jgi:hypothetical protein
MANKTGDAAETRGADIANRAATRQTVRALAVVFLCIALALVVWHWWPVSPPRLEPIESSPPNAPALARASDVDPASDPAPGRAAVADGSTVARVRMPRACRLVATLVSAFDQAPVEGAACSLSPCRDDPDVLVSSAGAADLAVAAVSDRHGHFAVDVDAGQTRRWRISITHRDRPRLEPVFVTVPMGATRFDCGRIELPPFAGLRVRVRQFGRPASDVAVYACSCDLEQWDSTAPPSFTLDLDAPHAVTDRDGAATLGLQRGSRMRVYAVARGTRVTWADLHDPTAVQAGQERELELELPAPSPLSCLLAAPPEVAGDAVLTLNAPKHGFVLQSRVAIGTEVAIPDPWLGERVQAGASLHAGNVWLTAYLSGTRPADDRLRLELTPFQHLVDVRWDVAAGHGDEGAVRVTLGLLREDQFGKVCDETVSLPAVDGRALLRPPGRAKHRVVGFHPSHGIAVTELLPQGGRPDPVRLHWADPVVRAAPVEVLVTEETGQAAAGAIVRLSAHVSPAVWPGPASLVFEAPTDGLGLARFHGVPCGTASIRVHTDGTAGQRIENVTVQLGLNRFAAKLEPLASLTVSLATPLHLADAFASMRVRTLARRDGATGPATTPDAGGVAVVSEVHVGAVDVMVECMGKPLCQALDWWDPFHALDTQWVPLATRSVALVAGNGNQVQIPLPDVALSPAVQLRAAAGGPGWRVAVTRLLPGGRPQGPPRSRTAPWSPSSGIGIAALSHGTYVFELLDGTSVRSWLIVDYQGVPLTVDWPGSSVVDLAVAPLECEELVGWHAGQRLPWLTVPVPSRPGPGAAAPFRCADGAYLPQTGGRVTRDAPVLKVSDGQLSVR